jgi:hypothetical protein
MCQDSSKIAITLSPAVISTYRIDYGLQTGIRYSFNNNWKANADIAFPLRKRSNNFESLKYLRFAVEVKKITRNYGRKHKYVSLQINYALRKFKGVNNAYYFESKLFIIHNS